MILDIDNQINPGAQFAGRYTIVRQLGAGAMGWVFEVLDGDLDGERIALKILYPHLLTNAESYRRFCNEVLIARKLSYTHIVQTYAFGSTKDGISYLTMELVEGENLKDHLKHAGLALPIEARLQLAYQAARGISFAHKKGVLHRDVKPHNMLLTPDATLKVADFGIACLFQDEESGGGSNKLLGSPHYMSPEQILDETLDERTDIYSFGITAYEIILGQLPFNAPSLFELARSHLKDPLTFSNTEVPSWVQVMLQRCAAKRREDRYETLEEVCEIFREQLGLEHVPQTTALTPLSNPRSEEKPGDEAFKGLTTKSEVTAGRGLQMLLGILIVLGLVAFPITKKVLWFYGSAVALAWAVSLQFKSSNRVIALVIFFLGVLVVVVRGMPPANKRAVALLLQAEYGYHIDLTSVKLFFGSRLRATREDLFKTARQDMNQFWSVVHSGLDPNLKDEAGDTLLHLAADENAVYVTDKLISAGARVEELDALGRTPIIRAIEHASYDLLEFLTEHGADVCPPQGAIMPLQKTIAQKDVAASLILLKHRAYSDPRCRERYRELGLDLLAEASKLKQFEIMRELGGKKGKPRIADEAPPALESPYPG